MAEQQLYRVEIIETSPAYEDGKLSCSWAVGPAIPYSGGEALGIYLMAPSVALSPLTHYLIWPGESAEWVRAVAVQWTEERRDMARRAQRMVVESMREQMGSPRAADVFDSARRLPAWLWMERSAPASRKP